MGRRWALRLRRRVYRWLGVISPSEAYLFVLDPPKGWGLPERDQDDG
jgi:hypothetical protein